MAEQADLFVAAIAPEFARTSADTLAAELLPLLEASRFLERRAVKILAPRRLGRHGLPFWLSGIDSEVQRIPFGKVLVIGPANYPLFLPGVQTLQALAAGNAVVWKPGHQGRPVAELFAEALYAAGLPRQLLRVTEDSAEAARAEIEAGAEAGVEAGNDKVFFTGSAETGRVLSRQLAQTATPCVMELSGCDAVIALPSADLNRVTAALAFGMRLNGSATCMAPRRLFLPDATPESREKLLGQLLTAFDRIEGVRITGRVQQQLHSLLEQASAMGATIHGEIAPEQQPIVVTNVSPAMLIAQADLFAPLLMIMQPSGESDTLQAIAACPYALTIAIFGDPQAARVLAGKITAGTILINDLIVPTADPRVPFGGRRQSGFGVTRGAEGLLEMTAVKVISIRRGSSTRHFEPTTERHESLFRGVILASHATGSRRWQGVKQLIAAARTLKVK